jgi:hypothetical protein
LFVACSSPFVASAEFTVARSATMATMDSAAASLSTLGLVFAAMLPHLRCNAANGDGYGRIFAL